MKNIYFCIFIVFLSLGFAIEGKVPEQHVLKPLDLKSAVGERFYQQYESFRKGINQGKYEKPLSYLLIPESSESHTLNSFKAQTKRFQQKRKWFYELRGVYQKDGYFIWIEESIIGKINNQKRNLNFYDAVEKDGKLYFSYYGWPEKDGFYSLEDSDWLYQYKKKHRKSIIKELGLENQKKKKIVLPDEHVLAPSNVSKGEGKKVKKIVESFFSNVKAKRYKSAKKVIPGKYNAKKQKKLFKKFGILHKVMKKQKIEFDFVGAYKKNNVFLVLIKQHKNEGSVSINTQHVMKVKNKYYLVHEGIGRRKAAFVGSNKEDGEWLEKYYLKHRKVIKAELGLGPKLPKTP